MPGLDRLIMLGFRARCLAGQLIKALTTYVIFKFPSGISLYYHIRAVNFNWL